MRPTYALLLWVVLAFASSCKDGDSVRVFNKRTDIADAKLKGKVKSVAMFRCKLDSADKDCSVELKKFNESGFLIEKIYSSPSDHDTQKYFYNEEGLLVRHIYTSDIFPSSEKVYEYSFPDRKRIAISRSQNGSGGILVDSIVSVYDKNGNEIQYYSRSVNSFSEYDESGFLVLERSVFESNPQDTLLKRYENDANGREVKVAGSDGIVQTFTYNKDGNPIQSTMHLKSGKLIDWRFGYCETDKNGNFLKRIAFCPQIPQMVVDSQVIEYY